MRLKYDLVYEYQCMYAFIDDTSESKNMNMCVSMSM